MLFSRPGDGRDHSNVGSRDQDRKDGELHLEKLDKSQISKVCFLAMKVQ